LSQGFSSLLQFKLTQILLHDVWHRHAQRGGKIAFRHSLLFLVICQEPYQAIGQISRISGPTELDCEVLSIGHLAEVWQIGAHDWNSISTRQMRYSAAASRRRIRHDSHRRALKKIRKLFFRHIPCEFDSGVRSALFPHGFNIARCLRVISPGNDQLDIGKSLHHRFECLEHQFEPLVGSPLTERKYAMRGIAAAGEIRVLGSAREDAVRPDMHVLAAIFLMENLAITGHEDRNGM
jgi:hypothetical protein